jgi:hypothetical protein
MSVPASIRCMAKAARSVCASLEFVEVNVVDERLGERYARTGGGPQRVADTG